VICPVDLPGSRITRQARTRGLSMIWVKPETPVRSETVFPSGPAFLKMKEMLWNGVGPTLEALCVRGPFLGDVGEGRPAGCRVRLRRRCPGAPTSFDP